MFSSNNTMPSYSPASISLTSSDTNKTPEFKLCETRTVSKGVCSLGRLSLQAWWKFKNNKFFVSSSLFHWSSSQTSLHLFKPLKSFLRCCQHPARLSLFQPVKIQESLELTSYVLALLSGLTNPGGTKRTKGGNFSFGWAIRLSDSCAQFTRFCILPWV